MAFLSGLKPDRTRAASFFNGFKNEPSYGEKFIKNRERVFITNKHRFLLFYLHEL